MGVVLEEAQTKRAQALERKARAAAAALEEQLAAARAADARLHALQVLERLKWVDERMSLEKERTVRVAQARARAEAAEEPQPDVLWEDDRSYPWERDKREREQAARQPSEDLPRAGEGKPPAMTPQQWAAWLAWQKARDR
jgi:hypothetical protein